MVVHPNQTRFIVGREARDNSNREIQLIHWAELQANHPPRLLLSTDADKAFERVDWIYRWMVLARLGLGPNMLSWLSLFYCSPEAKVKVNGVLSGSFLIRKGMRQGCPLSPLIFAMTFEPLLNKYALTAPLRALQWDRRSIYCQPVWMRSYFLSRTLWFPSLILWLN